MEVAGGLRSGVWVSGPGQALPEDGRLVACERDERPLELARRAWHDAGVAHKVKPFVRWPPVLFCRTKYLPACLPNCLPTCLPACLPA